MIYTRFLKISLVLIPLLLAAEANAGHTRVFTFFEGTQYPLTVHFIAGDAPGPTVFIQGGIQGDEAAGFLTAQTLTRAKVRKGNLIVVPRANLPSIHVRQRQVNVDLNRRFDKDYNQFYEDRLARVIRFLLSQSQAAIHLHEGSGFYRPTQIDDLHGPKRYGQSVIIDTSVYKDRVQLAKPVQEALTEINDGVSKEYAFHLFNMNTLSDATPYLEQRKSLTYFALCGLGIPAMGVEVSKNIPDLSWKVAHQLRATILLAKRFGVDLGPLELRPSDLKAYPRDKILVTVNGQKVTGPRQNIALSQDRPVSVSFEYQAGDSPLVPEPSVFASDRPGVNLAQAPRLPLAQFKSLDIRADGVKLCTAEMVWTGAMPKRTNNKTAFVCWLNGELNIVPDGGVLEAVLGDQLIMEGVLGGGPSEVINFKGYVTQPHGNLVQDAGQEIILDPSQFIKKFMLPPMAPGESLCEVVWENGKQQHPGFRVRIKPRHVVSIAFDDLQTGQPRELRFKGAGKAELPPGNYRLAQVTTNGRPDKVQILAQGKPLKRGDVLLVSHAKPALLDLRLATTFEGLGEMTILAEAGHDESVAVAAAETATTPN